MKKTVQNTPEITGEGDDQGTVINPGIQKDAIRRIIQYQKSLYHSSSSSSAVSCSLSSSHSKRSSLLDLMKGGNTSLRRLFDMEHTRLSTHFSEYSGSPIIKPTYLWGSDEDEGAQVLSPWTTTTKRLNPPEGSSGLDDLIGFASDDNSVHRDSNFGGRKARNKPFRTLSRTKSFRTLPGLEIWGCGGFRFRMRRLRVIVCGRKFGHKKA